jgi:hypothetical protein
MALGRSQVRAQDPGIVAITSGRQARKRLAAPAQPAEHCAAQVAASRAFVTHRDRDWVRFGECDTWHVDLLHRLGLDSRQS